MIATAIGLAALLAAMNTDTPIELGRVTWSRDYDAAMKQSADSGKPVLLLFQEIPGCQGCQDFGTGPMSHPLIVEAIEDAFIPVVVNNRGGGANDALLEKFGEPKLNYPVMRFLDANAEDLIPRRDRIWSTNDVSHRLVKALEAAERDVPGYLALVADESDTAHHETAIFAMHCYWDGEAKLGAVDGVVGTSSGWLGKKEVVEVTFDPRQVAYGDLVRTAQSLECASTVFATDDQYAEAKRIVGERAEVKPSAPRDAKASDRKFALGRHAMRYLPLTPMQATNVNAALRLGEDPRPFISPRQWKLLLAIDEVLDADDGSLDGLERPEKLEELAAYDTKLRLALVPK